MARVNKSLSHVSGLIFMVSGWNACACWGSTPAPRDTQCLAGFDLLGFLKDFTSMGSSRAVSREAVWVSALQVGSLHSTDHSITILGPFIILTFLTIPMVLRICRFYAIYFFTHSFCIIPFSCLLFLQDLLFIEHACSFVSDFHNYVFSVLFSLAESFLIIPIFSKNHL